MLLTSDYETLQVIMKENMFVIYSLLLVLTYLLNQESCGGLDN
jgi:hypothetical protein